MTLQTTPVARSFFFDPEALGALAEKHQAAYAKAEPFPHVVLEDFLPRDVAEEIAQAFPRPDQIRWHRSEGPAEKKLSCEDETEMPEAVRLLLYAFNSSVFVNFLEKLTGIQGLIPDPHFRGGGMHQIEPGGHLAMHADFNLYWRLNLQRRLNGLLYLNKDWKEQYGGHLELWDRGMGRCVKSISPVFGRFVMFSTTDTAFHGHPDPLKCPEGMTRKSLALYYYTVGRPQEEHSEPHTTLFVARPGSRDAVPVPKPKKTADTPAATPLKSVLKRCLPPILLDAVRALKR